LGKRDRFEGGTILRAAPNRTRERGGSRFNLIITLVILGVLVFVGVKIVPVYFANYQLQDAVETEARFAIADRRPANDIRDDLMKKIQELGIPARREDIKVNNQQRLVEITVDYSVPIDLQVYQLTLQFHPHADNRTL